MNWQSGSSINGFEIIHEGNHNRSRHQEYAIDNNYMIVPKLIDSSKNYCKICSVPFNKRNNHVLIFYDIDVINVSNMNKTTNAKITMFKENGEIKIKSNNTFNMTGNMRIRSYHVDTGTDTHRIETYVQIDDENKYIVKCNKFILSENGVITSKESEFPFSSIKNLITAPSSSDTKQIEFVRYNSVNLQNKETSTVETQGVLTPSSEVEIMNITINQDGKYQFNYKNAVQKPSNDCILEIKIYKGSTNMYQQSLRIDNKATNIHDISTIFDCAKGDVIKIVGKNLGSTNLTTVPTRIMLVTERIN